MKRLAELRESILDSVGIHVPLGRLRIPRDSMPQIAKDDYPEFLDMLASRGISVVHRQIQCAALRCAQDGINTDKVREWASNPPPQITRKPILVSVDNYVVDGNHTWLAKLNHNPVSYIGCVQIGLPIEEIINISKSFYKVHYKTVNEASSTMLFDIPESLVAKVQKVLDEDATKKKDKGKTQLEKKPGKKEEIIFNPEVNPTKITEPFKVQTTSK
jgi:hypothetical protein